MNPINPKPPAHVREADNPAALVKQARDKYEEGLQHRRQSLQALCEAGRILLRARMLAEHDWLRTLAANWKGISERQAQKLMKLAKVYSQGSLPAEVADMGLSGWLESVAQHRELEQAEERRRRAAPPTPPTPSAPPDAPAASDGPPDEGWVEEWSGGHVQDDPDEPDPEEGADEEADPEEADAAPAPGWSGEQLEAGLARLAEKGFDIHRQPGRVTLSDVTAVVGNMSIWQLQELLRTACVRAWEDGDE